jgi:hypothetical protein
MYTQKDFAKPHSQISIIYLQIELNYYVQNYDILWSNTVLDAAIQLFA